MDNNVPPHFRKWVRECIRKEFQSTIEKELQNNKDSNEIVKKVIQSKEMIELIPAVRSVFDDRCLSSRTMSESRPQTSLSIGSDLSCDEWEGSMRLNKRSDTLASIINKIGYDKPIHVRLAGYEALLTRSDITNIGANQSWEILLKVLRDGIVDDSQPIFEASLKAHGKLLHGSQSEEDVFKNLLNSFNALYFSKRLFNSLPTLTSGVNFKIFLHEKLTRLVYMIIRYQEESLKSNRNTDKILEEVISQFVSFLNSDNNNQSQNFLTVLNIVSILDPKSNWFDKWYHSLTTRKILITAIGRSPLLIKNVLHIVRAGLTESPTILTANISDDIPEVNITGETVKTVTYLHCLCLLTKIFTKSNGRQFLLTEIEFDEPFNIPEFMLSLLNSLNNLAIGELVPSSIYDTSRSALRKLLDSNSVLYDARFHELALDPLLRAAPDADRKIHPHTIDAMMKMLDTEEGSSFMISKSRDLEMNNKEVSTASLSPASKVLEYLSDLLRQPISIMNIEHVVDLLKFVRRLFELYDVCFIVKNVLEYQFYPSIAYLYDKIDKYSIENGNKKQILDSAIKTTLLKIVSMPLALQLLTNEELVFEELLRGSIEPLKSSWSCNDVVSFASNASLLPLGFKILKDLAPHFLTQVLSDICTKLEDPNNFYDPWEDADTKDFLHILRVLSLNNSCFIAVLSDDKNEEDSSIEDSYPRNLSELLNHSLNSDSPYHCLALMALNSFIHNLNANIHLNRTLNFQKILLNFQENCIIETESESDTPKVVFTIDEGSLLRHKVLLNSYYVGNNNNKIEDTKTPEQTILFSELPPPLEIVDCAKSSAAVTAADDTELERFLRENKPGLRDTGWVSQARKAHRISSKESMKRSVLIDLLDQMQKAVPTFELTSNFKWTMVNENDGDASSPEEIYGIELALLYAEQNELMKPTPQAKSNLKIFLKEVHGSIKYKRFKKFEGFDWFLATVFIICDGSIERSKIFIAQIVKFPSIIYVWPSLGKILINSDNLSTNFQIVFSHLLEGIIEREMPTIKYALKNDCGTEWSMICNGLISQCFWRTLPWHEIMNLLSMSILYPPDYILYYCASLLNHSKNKLMDDIVGGKLWPEYMDLGDYNCGNCFQFMDLLSKRYRNTTLSLLMNQEMEITA